MKSFLLDTNVLIRFFVADELNHYKHAVEWFVQAEKGEKTIVITSSVIAEVTFVLEKVYHLERTRISELLQIFVSQKWLVIPERSVLQQLWPDYIQGHHFVDSYLIAKARIEKLELLSFDKKLLKAIQQ